MFSIAGCAANENDGTTQLPGEASQALDENNHSSESPSKWGITLSVENVTAKGLTLVCTHSGGKNVAQLDTGSYYIIQKSEKSGWEDVEYLPHEYEIAWDAVAWMIKKEDTTTWDINWEWLYGELPAGEYRIGKEIMNFRGTGDYDTELVYAEFTIR